MYSKVFFLEFGDALTGREIYFYSKGVLIILQLVVASHIENPTACSSLANKRQPGVIIELWQGIDGYLIEKLLQDPRFPDMPTKVFHSPVFQQPRNWGNTFGTRIRGYFVPQKTGLHIFFIGKKTRHVHCI